MERGWSKKEFERKVNRLEYQISTRDVLSNIPHGVSDAERRAITRAYRRDVAARINRMYADNPEARSNALEKLRQSDIDHIRDLQLGGENVRSNLKSLDSPVNQGLGRQVSRQLVRDRQEPILGVSVIDEELP